MGVFHVQCLILLAHLIPQFVSGQTGLHLSCASSSVGLGGDDPECIKDASLLGPGITGTRFRISLRFRRKSCPVEFHEIITVFSCFDDDAWCKPSWFSGLVVERGL